jgi:hypothetical protein
VCSPAALFPPLSTTPVELLAALWGFTAPDGIGHLQVYSACKALKSQMLGLIELDGPLPGFILDFPGTLLGLQRRRQRSEDGQGAAGWLPAKSVLNEQD